MAQAPWVAQTSEEMVWATGRGGVQVATGEADEMVAPKVVWRMVQGLLAVLRSSHGILKYTTCFRYRQSCT